MQKVDIQQFALQLNALAETYEKRPVSPKALEVWFDVLKEFPTEKVLGCLINWPKFKGKFPTPSEVWRDCNDLGIKEREEKAAFERAQNVGSAESYAPTPHGRAMIAHIRAMLAGKKSRTPGEDDEPLGIPEDALEAELRRAA